MKYFFVVTFFVFLMISCSKQEQNVILLDANTSTGIQVTQDQVNTQEAQNSTWALSLSGNAGTEQKIEVVLPEWEVSAIHVNIPEWFALKNAVVDRPKNLAVKQNDAWILWKLWFSFSSPAQENRASEITQDVPQTTSIKDSSTSTTNAWNTLESSISPSLPTPQIAEKPKTLLSRVLSIIPWYPKEDTTTPVQNNNIQTQITSNTIIQTQNPISSPVQNVATNSTQGNTDIQQTTQEVPIDTISQTNQTSSWQLQGSTTQTGEAQISPSTWTDTSWQTGTSTSSGTQQDQTTDWPTQVSSQVEIIDTNLPDLSKYPITSQSGSVYVFEDTQRQMWIVISLHNRWSYGTAAELINPTLYYLWELSRQDLEPWILNNSHSYPKFDVQAEWVFDSEQRIFYIRFYDFWPILVYIWVYTTPEKYEENDVTMKTIIDTFLWNEEY